MVLVAEFAFSKILASDPVFVSTGAEIVFKLFEVLSVPIGANGFGLPSLPRGISITLESRRDKNAGLENIAVSKVMPDILVAGKLFAEFPVGLEGVDEEVIFASSGVFLLKK